MPKRIPTLAQESSSALEGSQHPQQHCVELGGGWSSSALEGSQRVGVPPVRAERAGSSSALEGSQRPSLSFVLLPDVLVVISPGGLATSVSATVVLPSTGVVISPGGLATRHRRMGRPPPRWSSSALEGSQLTLHEPPLTTEPVVISPVGLATPAVQRGRPVGPRVVRPAGPTPRAARFGKPMLAPTPQALRAASNHPRCLKSWKTPSGRRLREEGVRHQLPLPKPLPLPLPLPLPKRKLNWRTYVPCWRYSKTMWLTCSPDVIAGLDQHHTGYLRNVQPPLALQQHPALAHVNEKGQFRRV